MLSSLSNRQTVSLVLVIFFLLRCHSDEGKTFHSGFEKRSVLSFPPNSLLQINMGITLTSDFERNSAVIALAFQQYVPLPEETQPLFAPSIVVNGRQFYIYDHLRDVISSYGLNGPDCLRKMVCQIGESPLVGGLLEDIVTWMLTPSRHRSIRLNNTSEDLLLESEKLGRKGGNCTFAYPECAQTPLDLVSSLVHL